MNKNSHASHEPKVLVDYGIRSHEVLCIDENNTNLGQMTRNAAINLAHSRGLNLVQVTSFDRNKIPTCKILESGKYKYDLSKRRKETEKRQRENSIKLQEVKFRPCTAENDLKVKAKKVEEFIEEGARVKVSITFKGREMAHQNVASQTLATFLSLISNAITEGKPSMDNKNLVVYLVKKDTK